MEIISSDQISELCDRATIVSRAFSELTNAGRATPEAAVQSMFWAMREANREALASVALPEASGQTEKGWKLSGVP